MLQEALASELSTIQGPFPAVGPAPGALQGTQPTSLSCVFCCLPLSLCLTLLSKIQDQGSTATFSHLFPSEDERGWLKEHLSAQAALTQPALVLWQGPVLRAPVRHT